MFLFQILFWKWVHRLYPLMIGGSCPAGKCFRKVSCSVGFDAVDLFLFSLRLLLSLKTCLRNEALRTPSWGDKEVVPESATHNNSSRPNTYHTRQQIPWAHQASLSLLWFTQKLAYLILATSHWWRGCYKSYFLPHTIKPPAVGERLGSVLGRIHVLLFQF